MSTARKLGLYGVALAVALGIGALVGGAVGPFDVGGDDHDAVHDADPETPAASGEAPLPGGLQVTQDGFTFEPEARVLADGAFAFTITGPDGRPVADYELLHDRELHLIVASRDLSAYAHVHPERDASGRWTVDLPDLGPGAYRAFADFEPVGHDQLTLGVDVAVPGAATASPLEPTEVDVVDGFEVTLDADLAVGSAGLTLTVRRDGEIVTTEPYLGAAGHLVALRQGDLAYLHVHPLDDVPNGPVAFAADVPSAAAYALFFDFQVDGVVRTARFVIEVPAAATDGDHDGDDHEGDDPHDDDPHDEGGH